MASSQNLLTFMSLIDATCLDEQAAEETILNLCQLVKSAPTRVASICVYPKWISVVKKYFEQGKMTITTVINFPKVTLDSQTMQRQIKAAIEDGADEIDIVFPYETFDLNKPQATMNFLQSAKAACGDHILKVIIESGEAPSIEWIEKATHCVVESGADFVKTSTGKTPIGATPEAVKAIAYALQEADRPCGLKISGGVRTIEQANNYLHIVESILGKSFITPSWLRFGASSLLDICIQRVGEENV
jgi:deoxyribose-phosphate aldolase